MAETIKIKRCDEQKDIKVEPQESEIKSIRRRLKTDQVEEFVLDVGAEKKYHPKEDLIFLFITKDQDFCECKIIKRNEITNAVLWGVLDKLRRDFDYWDSIMVDVSVEFGQPYSVEFGEI